MPATAMGKLLRRALARVRTDAANVLCHLRRDHLSYQAAIVAARFFSLSAVVSD